MTHGRNKSKEIANLWLCVAGQGVSMIGQNLYAFAMGLYILELTGSAQSYAITVAVSLLPMVIISPIAGYLTNRLPKKLMVAGSDILNAALMGIMLITSRGGITNVNMIYVFTFLQSLLVAFLSVVLTASSPGIVTPGRLQALASYRTTVSALVRILGPILGGAMFALIEPVHFILLTCIAFLISGISELFIDFNFNEMPEAEKPNAVQKSLFADIAEGLRYIAKRRILLYITLYSIILNLICSPNNIGLPYLLRNVFGFGDKLYGFIISLVAVGNIIASAWINKRNTPFKKRIILCSTMVFGTASLVQAIMGSISLPFVIICTVMVILMLANGIANPFINIPPEVYVQKTTEPEQLGRVTGISYSSSVLLSPVGYLLSGWLIDRFGVNLIIGGAGVCILLMALIFSGIKGFDEEVAHDFDAAAARAN